MNVIQLAIRQPVTVSVIVLLILLSGVIALGRLPIALTPDVGSTIVTVTTIWEGASPEEVEQNVIDVQEERLLGLSNLRLMTSTSRQGSGAIRLEFETGTDLEAALREVDQKLNEVPDYPDGVDEPVLADSDPENRDYISWIVLGTDDPVFDIRTLRDFALDRIEPALERVAGVSEINVLGGRERELQIHVDTIALAQYGITPTRLANVIRSTNQNVSAGRVSDGKLDVRVRTIGQFRTPEDAYRTVIQDTEAGQVVLGDVARVVETFKEPTSFVRSRGRPVIAINADREQGSNVIDVMERLRGAVGELNMPGGVLDNEARRLGITDLSLTMVYDQTVYIDDALALVRSNIWIGGSLAVIVLILFLRSIRTVAILALSIPISLIGAVVAMVAMGRSINVISLAGMAFAVGMVVDNAIVVLENIFRHIEMGKKPATAAYDGAREVWGAVLASTLTTIAVFVPILLIQEEAGQLFRDIALAICAALTLSLIISITLIPSASARLIAGRSKGAASAKQGGRGLSALIAGGIYKACGSVWIRLAIIVILTAVSVFGTIKLRPPADYLPQGNRNLVFGLVIPPPGFNIEQFEDMAFRIEDTVRPFWEAGELIEQPEDYDRAVADLPGVPTFDWMTQQPGPPIVPPTLENYFLVHFEDILFHGGVSDDPRRVVDIIPLFSHATRAEVIPGVIAFPLQVPLFQLGGSTGSAVKVQLVGPELDDIVHATGILFGRLMGHDSFQSIQPVPSNFSIPGPELQVRPDLVRLSELGLTIADIGMMVMACGDGAIIDDYNLGGETIDLKIISMDAVDQDTMPDIEDVPLATPSGHVVSLGSIARIERIGSPAEIARVGWQRAVTLDVTAAQGVPLEQAVADLEGIVEEMRTSGVIPESIAVNMAGSASKLRDVSAELLGDGTVVGALGSTLVLALVVVYLLMCVLFQSFTYPLVIMFSVPLATLGGFAALFGVFMWSLFDPYLPIQKLDVLTMLGFIILIGVVVNNAILIVHQSLNFIRGAAYVDGVRIPLPPRRAIAEAVRTRIRPIFMSTLTSVGGMAALVVMPGAGSELYRGLGSVVVGGLLVSTIFTIVLVPLLLSLLLDLQQLMGRGAMAPRIRPETAGEAEVAQA